MAYGSIYPATYQPMYYPQQMMPQQTMAQTAQQTPQPVAQSQSGIVWVQGEAGAKSYLLAPNTILPLWDSEAQTIYLKSTDNSGMPTIKYIDYTIREPNQKSANNIVEENHSFATKDDIKELSEELVDLKRRVDNISTHRSPSNNKRREVERNDD